MILLPLQDSASGCASYIVGDETSGEALVIDPLASLGEDAYLLALAEAGLKARLVLDSHVHADHRSAARDLANALDVPLGLHHAAPAVFPFLALGDGQHLAFGQLDVLVLETPGHTPDSLSLVVSDRARGPEPWVAFTGDALFVGDVGRPDLAVDDEEAARAAARALFSTLHDKLLALPDSVEVYPAHFGASSCGGLFLNKKASSTIGFERRHNRLVQIAERNAFVDQVLALRKPPPEDAAGLRRANLGQAPQPQAAARHDSAPVPLAAFLREVDA